MEYMGDQEFWDRKFNARGDQPLNPEQALVEHIACFKKGSVLDLACGDGRNALFLLKNGFVVTGLDFSAKALERLGRFAKRKGWSVNTLQRDLSRADALEDIGVFDNIVVNHYRLSGQQLIQIEQHLSDSGILFVTGFGHRHRVDNNIREQELLQQADFEKVKEAFEQIHYDEFQDDRGFFVTYIFRKRSLLPD